MKLPFWKYESIGNDFPILHIGEIGADVDLPDLAVAICDRRFGVGGDGLLTMEPISPERFRLRMFNPDGTEDFCGNGLRCAARHAADVGWVGDAFTILHLGRTVPVHLEGNTVVTEIGVASYKPEDVPLQGGAEELFQKPVFWSQEQEIVGSALSTGSTHTIVPVSSLPLTSELERLGPLIENFELFPQRTSIIWRETVRANHLKIRIWERGVGETLGCGTGSSAAATDYLRTEGRGGRVQVDNPGGTVWVSAQSWNSPITVVGEARQVFSGALLFHS
jgi:diaminopimelate epimerase